MSAVHALRHRGDPSTSLHAARTMVDSGALAAQEAEVLALVRAYPGRTFEELSDVEGCRLDKYAIARRVGRLIERGLVYAGDEKRTSSGRMARTYWPVEKQGELL